MRTRSAKHTQATLNQNRKSTTKSSRKRPRISTNSNSDSTSEDEPENPTSSETEQANPTSKNQHTSNRPPQDEEVGFDLDNFESHLESWSLSELRATLQKKKHGTSNCISPKSPSFSEKTSPPVEKVDGTDLLHSALRVLNIQGASEGARISEHFSGIPCNFEDEPEDNEEESDLTTDEIELYKPLYDKLVNIEKVNIVAAKGSECQGENTSQTYKKALSATLKLNSEEYSNDAAWLALAKKKWSAKETFEAYSHAREIQGDLEKIVGRSAAQKQQKDSDLVKIKLRQALNNLLS
ncbi:hypothetical protein PGTUg99_037092 [Puccinia graminis f. sp. tritici]|uniref:Uncharacterized protein n=1 Tax=Puccinia graminis f. sp. tritici TaxID=56615 RepID=A0A5B0LYH8_PUCGR|nr:hypothetical protein PGTUg99_037092 [Puccinia graminis f. sp. tritici]